MESTMTYEVSVCQVCGGVRTSRVTDMNHVACLFDDELDEFINYWEWRYSETKAQRDQQPPDRPDGWTPEQVADWQKMSGFRAWKITTIISCGRREKNERAMIYAGRFPDTWTALVRGHE